MIVWRDVFLGVIAVATLAIAIAQIGVIIAAGLMARRVGRMVEQLERDVKPLFGHLNAIGTRRLARRRRWPPRRSSAPTSCSPMSRSASSRRSTSSRRRSARPAREGRAMMGAFRAALQAIREIAHRPRRQGRGDDEDALFI